MANWLQNNSDLLLAMGGGLLGGRTAQEQSAGLATNVGTYLKDRKQRNATTEWLKANNPDLLPMLDAGMSPVDLLSLAYKQRLEAQKAQQPNRKFQTLPDGTFGWADENAGTWMPLGKAEKSTNLPAAADEYEYAKSQGFNGSFMDYQASKREKGGDKAPSGYRWTGEDQAALEPIPGGPGEQIAGELAARVGMAENFQRQLPDIKLKVKKGEVTGIWDRTIAGTGRGDQGETYRQIQSGVDALQRLLTGAGMNVAEAEQYARRYLPSYTDDAQTVMSKLDQLSSELESTKSMAMRGRGGAAQREQTTPGVIDYTDYFK